MVTQQNQNRYLYVYSNCHSKLTAIIVTRGYYIYKNTSWTNAKMGEKVIMEVETKIASLETDPFAFAIRLKIKFFDSFNLVYQDRRQKY